MFPGVKEATPQPSGAIVRPAVSSCGGLQPFYRRNEPRAYPLARLVLHTNHAKHRTSKITAVRLAAMYEDDQMPRSVSDHAPRPEEPLRVGDVFAETPTGTRVPVALFPTVGINWPGTDRWPVLMQELEQLRSPERLAR